MENINKSKSIMSFLIVVIFVLNISVIYGQNSKEEREAERRRIKASNISSITVTRYEFKFGKPEEEGTKIKILEYNDEGYIIQEIRYKYGEDEFKKNSYKYNKAANETEITTIDADDYIKKIVKEKYNKNGDISEETEYGPSGDLKYKIIYEYDVKNLLTKETNYNSTGNIQKYTEYTYDGSNLIEKTTKSDSINIIEKFTYKYDGSNNRIEENEHKRDGNIKETFIYKYEGSNRIEEIKQDPEGKMFYKVVNKYDGAGNKIERTLYTSDGITISVKVNYKYDKNGNLMEEIESDKIGEKKKKTVYEF